MKKGLVCSVCGYVHLTEDVPNDCPSCNSCSKIFKLFDEKDEALYTKDDVAKTGESEKKHLPVIKITDVENGYKNISVSVGELEHPMIKEHLIQKIYIYVDKVLVSITALSANIKPETNIKIKTEGKEVAVVAHCNIHGDWITTQNI